MAGKATSARRPTVPTEAQEQAAIVQWLRWHRICFAAIPNGDLRHIAVARRLKATGVCSGVPDILIFEPASSDIENATYVGTALEMKRQKPASSRISDAQRQWLEELAARGWATVIGFGADDAIDKLRALGYGANP